MPTLLRLPRTPVLAALALAALASLAIACGHRASPSTGDSPGAPPGTPHGDEPCDPSECGPAMRMPSRRCPDGTTGGPTGRCLRKPDGRCGWEVRACPPG